MKGKEGGKYLELYTERNEGGGGEGGGRKIIERDTDREGQT
jgi:hypothetical protein